MKSWEVLREASEKVGVKAVASRLHVSSALVYKWCQEPGDDEAPGSGARNPLDRVRSIVEVTGDERVVNWLCNAAGGFFVRNPRVLPEQQEQQLLGTTQRVVHKFGDLLATVSRSIANDGRITHEEAVHIRSAWERLKGLAETFVVACEQGHYAHPHPPKGGERPA